MAQYWTDDTLLLALQDDLTTPSTLAANEFQAVLCERPSVKFDTDVSELDLTSGQVGAAGEVIVGRRSGTMTVVVPLQGCKDAYDPTAENPGGAPVGSVEVLPPWFILMANALGCNVESLAGATLSDKNTNFWRGTFLSNSAYGAAKVTAAGTDSTHVQGDAAEGALHKAGQLILAAISTAVAPLIGFIKTKVVDLMTLFEAGRAAAANYDDNGANIYGTATAWQSDDQPRYLTAYLTGPDTKLCYVITGLVCEGFTLNLNAGDTPTIEFAFRFYDYQMDKTKGGLVVPDAYDRMPQLVGNKSGVLMLDGAVKCGLEDVKLEWKADVREQRCHYAPQGIGSVAIVKPRTTISFVVPHDKDDVVYDDAGTPGNTGSHVWQSSLELGTTHSVGVYVGPAVGRCLGVLLAAGRVSAAPSMDLREGMRSYAVQLTAGTYTGDSTDTAETSADSPLDSPVRVGIG